MNYYIYIVSLLTRFERYLPFMSEEELMRLLEYGEEPDAMTISVWEIRKSERDARLEKVLRRQNSGQK